MKLAIFRLALFSLQELLKYAPELFLKIHAVFTKPTVTTEDLVLLLKEVESDSYGSIVTNTKLSEDQKTK